MPSPRRDNEVDYVNIEGIVLYPDLEDECNISMKLYAERLARGLRSILPKTSVEVFSPRRIGFPMFIHPLVDRIPYVRFYNKEQFISRNIVYPMSVRKKSGIIHHVLGHNNANLVPRLDPERTVVTCHDLQPIVAYIGTEIKPKWLTYFERRARGMEGAARVIAISESTKRDIMRFTNVSEDRIRVIYNAVDSCFRVIEDREYLERVKRKYGLGDRSGKIVLNVGSNQRRKNIHGAVRAIAIAGNLYPDITFVHVGQKLNQEQESLVGELGLNANCIDTGRVSQEDLVALYNIADLLLFPSFYEGFGWPIVEAFACGTPVITSNTSSMPEVAGDAAILIDPDNLSEIADAVIAIFGDENLQYWLEGRGMERVKEFGWEKYAQQLLGVYRDVEQSAVTDWMSS